MIFHLPEKDGDRILHLPRYPLAHIEWYTKLKSGPDGIHGMYYIQKPREIEGVVVPLIQIRQGCMLFPNFGTLPAARRDYWDSDSVLDICDSFFLNHWQSTYSYQTLY